MTQTQRGRSAVTGDRGCRTSSARWSRSPTGATKPRPDLTKAALAKLSGTVSADGSSTVGPYTTAAAELFRRAGARNVRVTVGISGTGGGFERFCKGEIDLRTRRVR